MTDYKTVSTTVYPEGTRVLVQRPLAWIESVNRHAFIWGFVGWNGVLLLLLYASGYLAESPPCASGWCEEVGPPHWVLVAALSSVVATFTVGLAMFATRKAKIWTAVHE